MAGVCSKGYQSVLKKVKDFLKGINELTDENKGRLNKLGEVSELVASVKKEKGGVEGTPGVQICIAIIENVLIALLTGLYTVLLSAFSDISSMIKEMVNKQKEDERFVLPQPMQARVDAVERYLKNANGRLEKIDDTLSNLIKQVKEATVKQFKISDVEIKVLEMNAEEVNRTLDACKKYLDQAENEINLLESDIASEMESFGMKTAAVTAGVLAVVMFGGVLSFPEILRLNVKEVAERLGYFRTLLLGAAAVTGAIAMSVLWKGCTFAKEKFYCKLLLIFRKHSRLRQELECDLMNPRSKDIHSNFVF